MFHLSQPLIKHDNDAYADKEHIRFQYDNEARMLSNPDVETWGPHFKPRLDYLKKSIDLNALPQNPLILDIGCQFGNLVTVFEAIFGDNDFTYHGTDTSELAIKMAKERHPSHDFSVSTIYDLHKDVEKSSCNIIVCAGMFSMLHDWGTAMQQVYRATAGQIFLLSLPIHPYSSYRYLATSATQTSAIPYYIYSMHDVCNLLNPFKRHHFTHIRYDSHPEPGNDKAQNNVSLYNITLAK